MGRKELAVTVGAPEMFANVPAGRFGVVTEIALAAQFLAGETASFITGTDLKIDGGWLATLGK